MCHSIEQERNYMKFDQSEYIKNLKQQIITNSANFDWSEKNHPNFHIDENNNLIPLSNSDLLKEQQKFDALKFTEILEKKDVNKIFSADFKFANSDYYNLNFDIILKTIKNDLCTDKKDEITKAISLSETNKTTNFENKTFIIFLSQLFNLINNEVDKNYILNDKNLKKIFFDIIFRSYIKNQNNTNKYNKCYLPFTQLARKIGLSILKSTYDNFLGIKIYQYLKMWDKKQIILVQKMKKLPIARI
jgi:hypothetical protein